ncbi:heparin lyase I family protein [Streptomyces sp. NPDC005356]|uniref:heparin lyase I family protein n=1 Tax=Streptomyces sp. NPDC005356 TaxID=3157167 RepID=UPI0033BB373A
MRKRPLAALATAAAWTLLVASPAHASVVWDGDASQGIGVFGNLDCPDPGSVITAESSTGHGTIFRYTKPAGDIRCESRGISVGGSRYAFTDGGTYYFGWESQPSTVSGDFVVWQWKSYPNADQNYPLIMTIKDGAIRLFYVPPGSTSWTLLWSQPIAAGAWNRYAVGIHASSDASSGWVELYFNGVKQTLADGTTRYTGRTWDSVNEPKWGAYDRDDGSTEITNRIDSLKLGTSYTDLS